MHQSHQQELSQLRAELQAIQPNLFIAEDNPVNRQLFKSLLSKNAVVDTVEDGEQAVRLCQSKRFSIILLDLQMPKINGLEAARLIRQESMLNKHTPILLISANACDISQEQLQRAGIELCLQKPIDEKTLLQHLLQLLKKIDASVIDWSLCLQKVSGNRALAIDFLQHFVMELKQNKQDFLTLMQNNDLQGLEHLSHKLHGACCFCGVTQLQQDVVTLERLAGTVNHVNALNREFLQLMDSIDAVLHEYNERFIITMES